MSIATEIEKIKNVRREKHADYDKLFEDIKRLVLFVDIINLLRSNIAWIALLQENQEMKTSWDGFERLLKGTDFINRVNALMKYDEASSRYTEVGLLKDIKDRIERPFVTISVMGPISAGKSVLLQALTGLDDKVIPVSADTCTATRSLFVNDETKSATVFFHKEVDVIKIVMKHVVILNAFLKNKKNTTVSIFEESDVIGLDLLSVLKKIQDCGYLNDTLYDDATIALDKKTTDCSSKDYFRTLKHYVENYQNYSKYLGKGHNSFNENQIMEGELKSFLAYTENVTYANAVEHVEIHWPLIAVDGESMGDIHLIDTMGIGEAKIGVTESLISTLRDETDIALALCAVKPSASLAQDPNTKMFQKTLKEAVVGRKPEQWIYYLLNKYTSASDAVVQKMKYDLEESLTTGDGRIYLDSKTWGNVEFLKADDSLNREGVLQYFTKTVLSNLANSIGDIDEHFMSKAKREICDLLTNFETIKMAFKIISVPSVDKRTVVRKRLESIRSVISNKFQELRAQSGDEIKQALFDYLNSNPLGCHFAYCFDSYVDIQKKIREMQSDTEGLPIQERIKERNKRRREIIFPFISNYDIENQYKHGHAFSIMGGYCTKMFDAFVTNFTNAILATKIVEHFQNFKRNVWRAFIEQGGLSALVSGNVSEWPHALTNKLGESNKYNDLKDALEQFNATKVELKEEILKSIKAQLLLYVYCHNNLSNTSLVEKDKSSAEEYIPGQFNDVDSFCHALFNLLINKEREIITGIINDFGSFVREDVLKQENLLDEIGGLFFGTQGLFPHAFIATETYPLNDQLLDFFVDNYTGIFGQNDDYAKKVEAIELYENAVKEI